jgi:HME family heavy-metal exporter
MFDAIVKFSLKHRIFILFGYCVIIIAGAWSLTQIPIDVLPDLNKPRVTVFADSEGL